MVVKDIQWGDMEIAPKWGTDHFLFVGATGSGKTTLINVLMKSVFASGRQFRAMVYDPKQEVLPILYSLLGESDEKARSQTSRVKVLHPLDTRCRSWNLAEDIDGSVSARQLATILVPESEGQASEGFFTNAVRDLLTGVLLVFIKCVRNPKAWTFRDVILTMLYEPYLNHVLNFDKTRANQSFPLVTRLRKSYLEGDPRTNSNIRASINTKLSIYEPIAATWRLAEKENRRFSLSDWVLDQRNDILILGNDEASRAAIDAVNRALFKRATELMLAKPEATEEDKEAGTNHSWFFLDEVREAGELDGLGRLMTKGRSKGACVVLGFQDIDGMRAVYGEEVAHEICGQCNHIAILRLNSASTADWASSLFGKYLARSKSTSTNVSSEGNFDSGRSLGEDERPYVYTSNFLYLPQTSKREGLSGFFKSPNVHPSEHELFSSLPWSKIGPLLPSRLAGVPSVFQMKPAEGVKDIPEDSARAAFLRRSSDDHDLHVWDGDDWKRLGFEGPFRDLLEEDSLKQAALKAATQDEQNFRLEEIARKREARQKREAATPSQPADSDEVNGPKAEAVMKKKINKTVVEVMDGRLEEGSQEMDF